MTLRTFIALILSLFLVEAAMAKEQINNFDVAIKVETSGDIVVTETIEVTSEGQQIRRGIFRDLPRYHEEDGARLPYIYKVLSVRRDGREEIYDKSQNGNAMRIRIGDADVFIENGLHIYQIRYRVKSQVRYFDDYDEIYWNATGSYWAFPIAAASARVQLPPGATISGARGYTGGKGATGADYTYTAQGDTHIFETTRSLGRREGLTIALGVSKGLIDPPSGADKRQIWWQRNAPIAILMASLLGVFGFYYRSFDRVGRDPAKGPVFPHYAPPDGYSPAAVHHIYYRGLRGHRALIATLTFLGVKDRLTIDASDKKETLLSKKGAGSNAPGIAPEDLALEKSIFMSGGELSLGKKYDAGFTTAYTQFKSSVQRAYGAPYFKWNIVYVLIAVAFSIGAVVFAVSRDPAWTIWHTGAVLALVLLNAVFMYFMPAPTRKGQKTRNAIEGFKLYLETAEKLQLNTVKVGSDAPPPMTAKRYEAFLPYAIALGVEKPWTKHFQKLIPEEARTYNPAWTNIHSGNFGSLNSMTNSLVSNISSGVTSALPQSSGSSGSGGGGFSGGGGGGGGGGGW